MPQETPAWAFEHSVDCRVAADAAWRYWTNVVNWRLDADVESIEIDGPFAIGARGVTQSKSSGRIEWRIADVQELSATIEFPLAGAVGRFVWTFQPSGTGTRIRQRCTLEGEKAGDYAQAVAPSLEAGIPDGMRKLCERMESEA